MKEKYIFLSEIDSTNNYVKAMENSLLHGQTVIALHQTNGRGSNGRNFFSPSGGIYMSMVVKPPYEHFLPYITPIASVAVKRAIQKNLSLKVGIKWVNDLYYKGKKVCGILCENTGKTVIIGIGVNLSAPANGFPPDIADIAGALLTSTPPENTKVELIKSIAKEFFSIMENDSIENVMNEYALASVVIGKRVILIRGNEQIEGEAIEISKNGHLVLSSNGKFITALSGTLRVIDDKLE